MEDFCSICQESQNTFVNQQSKFVSNNVQSCGHLFCQTCISRQLDRRKSFPCPICSTTVSKLTLSTQSLDMKYCDDDATWRKRIKAVYNKSREDFEDLVEYNNYLEEVEDVIYSIVNDTPDARGYIEKVKRLEHTDEKGVTLRQSIRAEEARMAEEALVQEDAMFEEARRGRNDEAINERIMKGKLKRQKMEVMMGERTEVSNELSLQLKLARTVGYAAASRSQKNATSGAVKNGTFLSARNNIRVFVNGELRDAKSVRGVKGETWKRRVVGGGGIWCNSKEDREMCWREALGSLFC